MPTSVPSVTSSQLPLTPFATANETPSQPAVNVPLTAPVASAANVPLTTANKVPTSVTSGASAPLVYNEPVKQKKPAKPAATSKSTSERVPASMSGGIWGTRFLDPTFRYPQWQELGSTFSAGSLHSPTDPDNVHLVTTAFAACNMLFEVENSYPQLQTSFGLVNVGSKAAVVRPPLADDPHPRILGWVGADYRPLQNSDIASILDRLTATPFDGAIEDVPDGLELLPSWQLETVGTTDFGAFTFAAFLAGHLTVAGRQLAGYFLFRDGKTGGAATRLQFVPVLRPSQITLNVNASVDIALVHQSNSLRELDWYTNIANALRLAQVKSYQALTRLAEYTLAESEFDEMLEATYRTPAAPRKIATLSQISATTGGLDEDHQKQLDDAAARHAGYTGNLDQFKAGIRLVKDALDQQYPAYANSAFHAYIAACEVADYRTGINSHSIADSALWGPRSAEKARAFSAVYTRAERGLANSADSLHASHGLATGESAEDNSVTEVA